jgi:hypothetical protein
MSKTTLTQITTPERRPGNLRPIWLHVLSSGTWPGQNGTVTIQAEDIQTIADAYDPAMHEAPAVLGHPVTDGPAKGWVRSLEVRADGLWANTDLQPEMAEMVNQQKYRKLSVSLYQPSTPGNPVPGSLYLKHVGFLGAMAPAVKGLQAVALADTNDSINIHFSEQETPMEDDENTQTVTLSETELAAKQQEIQLAEADLGKRRKALRREELTAKLTPHVQAGRVLPSQKSLLIELAERCDGQTVNFSEAQDKGQDENLLDAFDQFLAKLPKQIELTEFSGSEKLAPTQAPVNFSLPAGSTADAESLVLHQQVEAHCKANPGYTYVESLRAIKGA